MAHNSVPEAYATCPYNKYHQILVSRLQFHLVKCKKSYTGEINLVECPFNSTHKVPEIELNCHITYSCSDRTKLDTFTAATEDTTPLFEVKPIELESSENWEDVYYPPYDPMVKCKNQPILINMQCVPSSVRKQFRLEERERMAKFHESTDETPQQSMPSASVRLPQTIPNTYFGPKTDDTNNSVGGVSNGGTVPKAFGRGRGRILK